MYFVPSGFIARPEVSCVYFATMVGGKLLNYYHKKEVES